MLFAAWIAAVIDEWSSELTTADYSDRKPYIYVWHAMQRASFSEPLLGLMQSDRYIMAKCLQNADKGASYLVCDIKKAMHMRNYEAACIITCLLNMALDVILPEFSTSVLICLNILRA